MTQREIVKRIGEPTTRALLGKKVIVTRSGYQIYNVGDIYLVDDDIDQYIILYKIDKDGLCELFGYNGLDAEFALYEDVGEQLAFKFL